MTSAGLSINGTEMFKNNQQQFNKQNKYVSLFFFFFLNRITAGYETWILALIQLY